MDDKKHLSILIGYSSIGMPVFSPVEFYCTVTDLVNFLEVNNYQYEDIHELHVVKNKTKKKLTIAQQRRQIKKKWRR